VISDEDAWELVGDKVLTNVDRETGPARWRFFIYLKQRGTWTKVAAGCDPSTELLMELEEELFDDDWEK
jgi:hypothetical protein